mgnify:CR=1 FL=1
MNSRIVTKINTLNLSNTEVWITEAKFGFRHVKEKIKEIQTEYLRDNNPWVIGYSGGKDSTVITQLTWMALEDLPKSKRKKPVYVITTDTLVENPIVANWVESSLDTMKVSAKEQSLNIKPYLIKPALKDRFWVNLLGKGYPAPRRGFRWCTDRLKIRPTNEFIKKAVNKFGEVVLVLGVRSDESVDRAKNIKKYADQDAYSVKSADASVCSIYGGDCG